MSSESDCALDGKAMKAERKERLDANRQKNWQVFANHGRTDIYSHTETVFIRQRGKPRCDYYLTKNKWKTEGNKIMHGDAIKFFEWFENQRVNL